YDSVAVFSQAEDGIRDFHVTGVQTCALPIFADTDLVLRVLEMYPDVTKREQEIRNMAATYNEISVDILPTLRRSEIKLMYDVNGDRESVVEGESGERGDRDGEERVLKRLAHI